MPSLIYIFIFDLLLLKLFFIFFVKKHGNVYFFSTTPINPKKFRYTFRYTSIF